MKLGSILVFSAFALSFGYVIACGDSAEEEAAKKKAADEKAAAEAEAAAQDTFLDTYCQIIINCCNIVLEKPKDVAACKKHLKEMDPLTVADKTARDLCLVQTKEVVADPHFCPDFQHAQNQACPDPSRAKQKALDGGVGSDGGGAPVGAICNTVSDCAPDYSGIVDCAAGICQLRKRGVEGDTPCDTTIDGDVTIKTAEAATEPTVFTCYREDGAGTQCDSKSRTCVVPFEDRAECVHGGSECEKTEYCDKAEKRCFPKLKKDSVCTEDAECKGHCVIKGGTTGDDDDDTTDDDDTVEQTGKCVDAAAEEGDCETTAWCMDDLECVSGTCTAPGPDARLGATCSY